MWNLFLWKLYLIQYQTHCLLLGLHCLHCLHCLLYKPPNSLIDPFESFFKKAFSKTKNANEMYHVADDFNLNLLDCENCKKVQDFLKLVYQNGMISTTNKPTRVARKTATEIDHISQTLLWIELLIQVFLNLICLTIFW